MMSEIPKKGDLFPPYFDITNVEIFHQGEYLQTSTPEQDDYIANAVNCFDEMYELLEYIKQYHCIDIDLLNSIQELLARARGEK